jgi:hypothetical protein
MTTTGGAMLLLCAGSLAVAGCGGDGGPAATCPSGQPCDAGGGVDGERDGGVDGDGGGDGPATTCLNGQPCGGGDGGGPAATCGEVPPCGGQVVGDWRFAEVCESTASVAASKASFSTMAAQSWCVGQTLVGIESQASGSLVFDADGTYALALVFGGYLDINYPASCLAGLSCADATAGFQSQIDDGTFSLRNVTSIACTGTSGCLCRATVDAPQYETGTYATSGSVVTFTASNGAAIDKSYCVEGNALHIVKTSTGSTGQTAIESDLVATKQ